MLREKEHLDKILSYAKIEKSNIKGGAQTFVFSTCLGNEDYKLLELDKGLIPHVEAGKELFLKGTEEDNAVLCTDSCTFDICEAETSNSILLTPDLLSPEQMESKSSDHNNFVPVVALMNSYYELKKKKPRLKNLRQLLERNAYGGKAKNNPRKVTFDDLLRTTQCSENELRDALKNFGAFEYEGSWQIVDFDLETDIVSALVTMIKEYEWDYKAIPYNDCLTVLELHQDYPRFVSQHVLQLYSATSPTDHSGSSGETCVCLDEVKISRLMAKVILRVHGVGGKYVLNDFLHIWSGSVPRNIKTDLSQLSGLAIVDKDATPRVVVYVPEAELSEDLPERFQYLFTLKHRWKLDEITPYISPLAHNQSVSALLTKFCRSSTINGVKYFNTK